MTVEEIVVMDSEHIEVHFRYRDEFELALQVLEAALSVSDARERVPGAEGRQMEYFLLEAGEGSVYGEKKQKKPAT